MNRIAQNKRQEKIKEDEILQSLQLELDALKTESIASSQSLQHAKIKAEVTAKEVSEKSKQLDLFHNRVEAIKRQLASEKSTTFSKEKKSQNIENRLKSREKEMKQVDAKHEEFRKKLFQESQHMVKLREEEFDLIGEIKSTQVSWKQSLCRYHALLKL